tara:strand:+ start:641 stop:763 length:123 start_codon:yes stop_codon:yes gene_type:complete
MTPAIIFNFFLGLTAIKKGLVLGLLRAKLLKMMVLEKENG